MISYTQLSNDLDNSCDTMRVIVFECSSIKLKHSIIKFKLSLSMASSNNTNINDFMARKNQSLFHQHSQPLNSSYLTYQEYFQQQNHQSSLSQSNHASSSYNKIHQTPTHQKQYLQQAKQPINIYQTQDDALRPTIKRQLFLQNDKSIDKGQINESCIQAINQHQGFEERQRKHKGIAAQSFQKKKNDGVINQQKNSQDRDEKILNSSQRYRMMDHYNKLQHQNPYIPSSLKKKEKFQETIKDENKNYKIHQLVHTKSKNLQTKTVIKEEGQQMNKDKYIRLLSPQQTETEIVKERLQQEMQYKITKKHIFIKTKAEVRQFLKHTNSRLLSANKSLDCLSKDIDRQILQRTIRQYDKLKVQLMIVLDQQINIMKQRQIQSFLKSKLQLVPQFYELKCNIDQRIIEIMSNLELLKDQQAWKRVLNGFVLMDYESGVDGILQRTAKMQISTLNNVYLFFEQYSKCLNYDYFVDLKKQIKSIINNCFGLIKDFKKQTMLAYKKHAQYIDS